MSWKNGFFIVLEGVDGAGSTTHSRLLAGWLRRMGHEVVLTKEPQPHGRIGRLIREYLQITESPPIVDALLFAADRVEHLENVIKPELARGRIVVSDRYLESSIAYQGAEGVDVEWIQTINREALPPDLTIVLKVDPAQSLSRKSFVKREKFETEIFLRKVAEILLSRASTRNYPVVSTDTSIEESQRKIRAIVSRRLKL